MDNIEKNYTDINSETIDRWVEEGWEWGKPVSHEEYLRAKNGELSVLLTPTKTVPESWFGALRGKKLLGLASGGGQQMPLFAAMGAECTVLDYSERQLESERSVAAREGYDINIVRGDMTKRLPFEDEEFDIIFHPVSNCYIEDVSHVWRECFRVLKKGGRLLAGLDNGLNFLFDESEERVTESLPYNPLKNREQYERAMQNDWGLQFSHTIEEQIGGQLRAGFILRDVYEDVNSSGLLAEHGAPAFWATLAVKPE